MAPLNAHCFQQPHWRVIALGYKVEDWFEDNQMKGSGGIDNPQPVDLPPTQKYYRFADSTSSKGAQVGGGWWIDYEAFHTIDKFSKENTMNLSEAARLFLALPYEWTRVDRLVSAILEVPLKAYAGHGYPASGNSPMKLAMEGSDYWKRVLSPRPEEPVRPANSWTPMQHRRVIQFYIPGLHELVPRKPPELKPNERARPLEPEKHLYEMAFPDPKFEYIHGTRREV